MFINQFSSFLFVFQISTSNATLTRPTTRDTQQSFIRGVTAPGMNPLPIYIPFLTEKVSFFVHFPFKMVSLKKSLFFASRVKCTVPPFFLFLNSMNRKKKQKKRYFLCILYFNPSFWVLFSTFHLYF